MAQQTTRFRFIDFDAVKKRLTDLHSTYTSADPFPHIAIDNFLKPEEARLVLKEFPPASHKEWTHYTHVNSKKLAQTRRDKIPPQALALIDELNTPEFIEILSKMTGIDGLVADTNLEGGGLHQTVRGGHLNMHADFTGHPHNAGWARRVNLLVYFNENWKEEYGGHLELWDRKMTHCVERVLPVFNRCVVFSTDPDSYHGHPHPLSCPLGWTRKSLALYYYTIEKPSTRFRSTEYKALPTDSLIKRATVYADKMILRFYFFLKQKCGLRDTQISPLLKIIGKITKH
jgi:Rps23 Pro-64 3,4-dihydroxylase Tpa1-like proline 4-hydroxylase